MNHRRRYSHFSGINQTGLKRAPKPVLFVVCLLAAVLLVSPSCKKDQESEVPKAPSAEIRKEYTQGSFRVRLVADRDHMTIARDLNLSIEAEAEPGYDVQMPGFGEKLGEFGIVDYREDAPRLSDDGRVVTRRVFRLEPFLSGEYKIAPMTVTFRPKPEGSEKQHEGEKSDTDKVHEIQTEELTITVESLVDKDPSGLQAAPIFDPVALPGRPVSLVYILLGVAALVLCIGGGVFWYRRKKERSAARLVRTLPAHELAYLRLQEILDEDLLERGEIKQFFSRISDVARSYIEDRFGLHAPKLTTEEFLASIGRNPPFAPRFQDLLDDFLNHCDLVKFAEYRPTDAEIRSTVEACRAFIDATRSEDVVVGIE